MRKTYSHSNFRKENRSNEGRSLQQEIENLKKENNKLESKAQSRKLSLKKLFILTSEKDKEITQLKKALHLKNPSEFLEIPSGISYENEKHSEKRIRELTVQVETLANELLAIENKVSEMVSGKSTFSRSLNNFSSKSPFRSPASTAKNFGSKENWTVIENLITLDSSLSTLTSKKLELEQKNKEILKYAENKILENTKKLNSRLSDIEGEWKKKFSQEFLRILFQNIRIRITP